MGNKSRGRHRFAQQGGPASDATEQRSRWADLMDGANTRGGLRKLVGAILSDRDKQLAEPEPAENIPEKIPAELGEPRGLREPTQYELAILSGLSRKPIYGGTVEPWRIDQRRRRNRAARKARRKANR